MSVDTDMRHAYYNEFDPHAAQWLRNLIAAGHIADGEVDERSIVDVRSDDLRGFAQCHFFAGVGIWSYALRRAGWADDRPIWTGSCPCQPFSAAGKRKGMDDERHLWPTWFDLIRECRPDVVVGEQVASRDGLAWFDALQADMEGEGYPCGAVDTCAAGYGAPHIRQRLYWVAYAMHAQRRPLNGNREDGRDGAHGGRQEAHGEPRACGEVLRVAYAMRPGRAEGRAGTGNGQAAGCCGTDGLADASGTRPQGRECAWQRVDAQREAAERDGAAGGVADTECQRICASGPRSVGGPTSSLQGVDRQRQRIWPDAGAGHDDLRTRPGPVNGHWRDADWLYCRDGFWRPVEPGSFPLAHGAPARVGRLRAFGNGLCAAQAQGFVEAVMECLP